MPCFRTDCCWPAAGPNPICQTPTHHGPIQPRQADLRDRQALDQIFSTGQFDAVVHFAGFKAVGESVAAPLSYYDNNFVASVALLEAMAKHGVKQVRLAQFK